MPQESSGSPSVLCCAGTLGLVQPGREGVNLTEKQPKQYFKGMRNRSCRLIALFFVGLLATQTAAGHFMVCLCEGGHYLSDMPQEVLACCASEDVSSPGNSTMETSGSGGCDDCVQVPLSSNDRRERDLPSTRTAVAGVGSAQPLQPASPSEILRYPRSGIPFHVPAALSMVIRI